MKANTSWAPLQAIERKGMNPHAKKAALARLLLLIDAAQSEVLCEDLPLRSAEPMGSVGQV